MVGLPVPGTGSACVYRLVLCCQRSAAPVPGSKRLPGTQTPSAVRGERANGSDSPRQGFAAWRETRLAWAIPVPAGLLGVGSACQSWLCRKELETLSLLRVRPQSPHSPSFLVPQQPAQLEAVGAWGRLPLAMEAHAACLGCWDCWGICLPPWSDIQREGCLWMKGGGGGYHVAGLAGEAPPLG